MTRSTEARLAALLVGALAACIPPDETASGRSDATLDVGTDSARIDRLAVASVPALDREMALTLAAMPLSCLDRPHAPTPDRRAYLDTIVATRVPGFLEERAFYGCWDWHSAVNSTWTLVRIAKEFPDLPISGLVEEKLADHLSEEALAGELAFFEGEERFERPYGWAWLLLLHAELRTWAHPEAEAWAERVSPLAALFAERTIEWLEDLKRPSRSGAHSNTAFSLAMMLEAARTLGDGPLERALVAAAERFFLDDVACPTAYEPWGSDFLSACLEEAALMAAALDGETFRAWLDDFLPPLDSRAFRPLTAPIDPDDVVSSPDVEGPGEEPAETGDRAAELLRALAAESHLIGLAFIRADAMNRIAAALPRDDPRVDELRRLAALHGARGFEAMFDADYAGSHWIGTFALRFLLGAPGQGRAP